VGGAAAGRGGRAAGAGAERRCPSLAPPRPVQPDSPLMLGGGGSSRPPRAARPGPHAGPRAPGAERQAARRRQRRAAGGGSRPPRAAPRPGYAPGAALAAVPGRPGPARAAGCAAGTLSNLASGVGVTQGRPQERGVEVTRGGRRSAAATALRARGARARQGPGAAREGGGARPRAWRGFLAGGGVEELPWRRRAASQGPAGARRRAGGAPDGGALAQRARAQRRGAARGRACRRPRPRPPWAKRMRPVHPQGPALPGRVQRALLGAGH
jgi:hypothetical protein